MKTNKKTQGKRNRAAGARFERKVRLDLEEKGWIVDRWNNNVELERIYGEDILKKKVKVDKIVWKENNKVYDEGFIGKLVPAKSRFNMRTTGFPDFICFKTRNGYSYYDEEGKIINEYLQPTYDKIVIGVEVKSNGYLDKEEKEKCSWLLNNHVFSKILIAKKGKKRGEIVYNEFNQKS